MSEYMVRKQIYLQRRQNHLLKRLAKQRGISEAEVIRQALEHEAQMSAPVVRDSKKALDNLITFARSLRQRPELLEGQLEKFNRAEIYREREQRWDKPAKEK